MDTSKGIWNPRDLVATLSIVSSPDGPYADREVEGGLFHYDYRAGSTEGDNAKLRRAGELALPLILFRKIPGPAYVPVFPLYVVRDDLPRRQFVIAVDESRETATARTYVHAVLMVAPGDNAPWVDVIGHYDDELVRGDDGWRIRRRVTCTPRMLTGGGSTS